MREFENRARASSFGADAEQYDRTRPSYPAALVDDLMADAPRHVVDIGCGTAKAGRLFAERGCRVVGIEPDVRMAEVARRYLPVVEVAGFEEWDAAGRIFDLAVSGQAWHLVHPVTNSVAHARDGGDDYVSPIAATGAFGPVEVRRYHWELRYTRRAWLDQLPTHSDHRLLPDAERARLMDAIGAVIDDFGGSFTMRYETRVITATRS